MTHVAAWHRCARVWMSAIALLGAALAPVVVLAQAVVTGAPLELHFIDVGQGDAALRKICR